MKEDVNYGSFFSNCRDVFIDLYTNNIWNVCSNTLVFEGRQVVSKLLERRD